MKKISYLIEGMRCQACSASVTKKVSTLDGIASYSINLLSGTLEIEPTESFNEQELIVGINSLGFNISKKKDSSFTMEIDKYFKGYQLIILLVFGIPLIYMSMVNMFSKEPLIFEFLNMYKHPIRFGFAALLLSLPIMVIAFKFYIPGIKNLIKLRPNMDSLVTIASISAYIYAIIYFILVCIDPVGALQRGYPHNLIFEAGSMIICLVYLGKYIEQRVKNKARNSINNLINIIPANTQKLCSSGTFETVCVNEIDIGDIILVKKGDRLPVDGEVIEGYAEIDNSAITGESRHINASVGSSVLAGAILISGSIQVKAKKISSEATINHILSLVSKSQFSKSKTTKLIDKVSLYFVPTTLVISLIVFLVWLFVSGYNVEKALRMFMNTLVIACPCAIGIATPLANVMSSLRGLKIGIVYKDMDVVSKFKGIDTVVFDKTGTLTTGIFDVILESKYEESYTDEQLYQLVGGLEETQNHPIANSFLTKLKELDLPITKMDSVTNFESLGIGGDYNGKKYYIGSKKLLKHLNIESFYVETGTTLYLVEENKVIAKFSLKDKLQDGAKNLINYLKKQGIETIMLTGDNKASAEYVANQVGVDSFQYELLPNDKYEFIQILKEEGRQVLFIGDGINDAPSLALSDISIAPYKASDIANDSSDIYLLNEDLNTIVSLFNLSKYTFKIIKLNIIWAFAYNCIAILFAAGVFVPVGIEFYPWMSALAMTISSMCVLITSLTINVKKIDK